MLALSKMSLFDVSSLQSEPPDLARELKRSDSLFLLMQYFSNVGEHDAHL